MSLPGKGDPTPMLLVVTDPWVPYDFIIKQNCGGGCNITYTRREHPFHVPFYFHSNEMAFFPNRFYLCVVRLDFFGIGQKMHHYSTTTSHMFLFAIHIRQKCRSSIPMCSHVIYSPGHNHHKLLTSDYGNQPGTLGLREP